MFRLSLAAILALAVAGYGYAQKGNDKSAQNAQKAMEKKEREAKIKALEEEIKKLHEQEKVGKKQLDDLYAHIIKNLDPKAVLGQLEAGARILHHIHDIISVGDFDYGGNRHAAQVAIKDAENQLRAAIHHDTPAERGKALHDLKAAHTEIKKALEYSIKKYGLGNGTNPKDKGEPESRGAANRQLVEALGEIEQVIHLLEAVNHEIKDYNLEKKELNKQKDEKKRELHEKISAQVKVIEAEIKRLREAK